MRSTLPLLLSVLLLPCLATAQQTLVPDEESRPYHLASGSIDNPTTSPRVAFADDVFVADAAWLRLGLRGTELPDGSRLRLTSQLDGAVQYFDAQSLRDYAYGSAYFNGDRVRVELIAAPGSKGNRLSVNGVVLGADGGGGPDSICGIDNRQLSSDVRMGRRPTSSCTWWLVNEFTILSAGHCVPSGNFVIGFNIPLSTQSGRFVAPSPDDQYAVDRSTLRRLNSGIGADWAVMAMQRNSNHGEYPGQRQGAWFQLGSVPSQISGVDIRITGYGSVSSPISPTWNYVQKTHVGPRVRTSRSNAISYQTDTTGGNSGSPVIDEATGRAIGIHTHGGCSSSSGNSGTRIDRSDLQSAIAQVLNSKVAGSFRLFGQGCAGSAGVPQLGFGGIPDVGRSVSVNVSQVPQQQPGVVLIGASNTSGPGGQQLPWALPGFGSCALYTSLDVAESRVSGAAGEFGYTQPIPNVTELVGTSLFFQGAVADASAPGGVVVSNAGEMFIGG